MMPLLNRIFEKAYGGVESNLCALSDRGWNPPNRKILDHPDLVGQEQYNGKEQESVEQVYYRSINRETEFEGTCIEKIISHQMRNGGIEACQNRLEEGADIVKNLKEAKKVTADVIVSNGIHSLNDPALVAHIRNKKRVEGEAGTKKETTYRNRLQDLISKVAQTRKKEEEVRMMRLRNGQQQNFQLTFNTRNFLKMAQYQQRLLKKGAGVDPSWKEKPQMFLRTRLMMEETTLMMMKEMRLMMK